MPDLILTEEEQMLQTMVRDFSDRELIPRAREADEKQEFSWENWKGMANLGLTGVGIDTKYGGSGQAGCRKVAIVAEEVARGDAGASVSVLAHLSLGTTTIYRFGNEEQKARLVPSLASGKGIAAWALTEPGSGSDAAGLKTNARLDGNHYVLNGTKQFISGAGFNDVYVTMVRTGEHKTKGITCLVVDKDTPGVSFGAPEKKLGWNASPTAQVIFEDAKVPVENRVGDEGEGFRFAMMGLDGGRLNIGACSLGGAQRCLDEAVKYTKERQQFDQQIADFQNTQFMLADMATDLEAARALL